MFQLIKNYRLYRNAKKLINTNKDKIKQMDPYFELPSKLKIRFIKDPIKLASLKQPHLIKNIKHWTLFINSKLDSKNQEFLDFLIMHELFHFWLGPDIHVAKDGIYPDFPNTLRKRMVVFLSKMPDSLKIALPEYKQYQNPYERFEEMFIDHALLKLYGATKNTDVINELEAIKEILSMKSNFTQLLQRIDQDMPDIHKAAESLLKLKFT